MDSKIASRKLGYGFSSEYKEIPLSNFIANAKKELETVPKFDPWRLISVERKKNKLFRKNTRWWWIWLWWYFNRLMSFSLTSDFKPIPFASSSISTVSSKVIKVGYNKSKIFDDYLHVFSWDKLSSNAVGIVVGCGSGHWAQVVAPIVGHLHLIDASQEAFQLFAVCYICCAYCYAS